MHHSPVRKTHPTIGRAPTRRVRFTHRCPPARQHGFTLVELLIAMAIGTILLLAINGVVGRGLQTQEAVQNKNELTRQAHFAMQQMVRAVGRSNQLLLPLNNSSNTNWPDNVREETIPPTTSIDDSTKYTAVLAVTQDPDADLDANGTPDADNDGDGRIDEDLPADITNDLAPGIYLIDDMGDGTVDKFIACCSQDDEEDFGIINEDPINGLDDDGDGLVDEDPGGDMNADTCPGVCGVDDNGNGAIDEGSALDDDEDGLSDEDWLDPVVFYLNGSTLVQRIPLPYDIDGSGTITGRDFITETIADNVTRFRVERLPLDGGRAVQVDLTLELASPSTRETISLTTRVRVGGAL